ncbi:hypothetical protein GCM10012288_22090 [Malaciobacter pacificus]|uniref:Primase C-terminal 1 domain-containing protein n=1 Tax=Malaciobacter pacificus TaxID=1080223 RepID=A0A5C2H943_9BACT|nr:replication initiation protein [Malaciobacter pacificus]QEP34738.1 hypothetical protein APAC_1642 [Malaciobacter pacificus]GGD47461.1 hypothetical protein GCM10012288_22090 [Malaciobacter pacificus]
MTKLQQYKTEKEELKELLIKNLPSNIKGGNEKHLSNIYEYQTVIALDKCKFINFNTSQRISFMVFDIDTFKNKTAKEHFKNIDGFYEFISEKIGLEPTYILETQKGFHFVYHLKNHIYTNQSKALKYLLDVKKAITELLKCDEIASHRLYGIWRNPLLHKYYYSKQINYELSDFKELIPKVEYKNRSIKLKVKINDEELIQGQRNNSLFKYAMRFAKAQKLLTKDDIFNYLDDINTAKGLDLSKSELTQISKSVFKYWQNGKILFGSNTKEKDINEGAMNFSKMRNLSYDEYLIETKMRQESSARRTLSIRDKEKNKNQLLEAKRDFNIKRAEKNQQLVLDTIIELQNKNEKITISSLSRETGLNRRTIKKYLPI